MTTAGGLVFMGKSNGSFDALDASTGHVLWSFHTGAGANAPPVTYEENGVQYVAIPSGGSHSLHTPKGDTVWVFRLGGPVGPEAAPAFHLPTVYTSTMKLTSTDFNPGNVIVGACITMTFVNDTDVTATITVAGTPSSSPLSPGATYRTTLCRAGAYQFTATSAAGTSVGHAVVAKELPKGSGCGGATAQGS